jgi:kynureninase
MNNHVKEALTVMLQARTEFPVLNECVYLNSNSAGAVPREVHNVLMAYSNTLFHWRDTVWEQWWYELHEYADQLAQFIGAPKGSVFTDTNLSTLLGRVGTCFNYRSPRTRVITSDLEFPTVSFLWQNFRHYGAEMIIIPSQDGCSIDEEAICAAIDERTQLVCLAHATFATGALTNIRRIAQYAHQMGALMIVDAYQSLGTVPIDVNELDADFLLGGAHKWLCGSYESAFLYVRPELLSSLTPSATGWIASANPLSFSSATEYASTARRFASGTPAVLPSLISRVGLEIIQKIGMPAIRQVSLQRTQRIIQWAEHKGLKVLTPTTPAHRAGIVSLRFPQDAEVANKLNERGFVCSYRNAIRIAPHFYNTDQEIELFLDALGEIISEIRK